MAKITDKKLIHAGLELSNLGSTPLGKVTKILLGPDEINRSKTSNNGHPNDNDDK